MCVQSYEVDRRRLSATLVRERNRQRSSLQARLKDRRSALEAETQAAAGQLKLRRQASEKVLTFAASAYVAVIPGVTPLLVLYVHRHFLSISARMWSSPTQTCYSPDE